MSESNPFLREIQFKVFHDENRRDGPVITRKLTDEERIKYGLPLKGDNVDMTNRVDVNIDEMRKICRESGTGKEAYKKIAEKFGISEKQAENQVYLKNIRKLLKEEGHNMINQVNPDDKKSKDTPAEEIQTKVPEQKEKTKKSNLKPKSLISQDTHLEYELLDEHVEIKGQSNLSGHFFISWEDLDQFIEELLEIKRIVEV